MANEIQVLVCDDAAKAQQAKAFLQAQGFTTVAVEQAATFVYDAATYDGGTNDNLANKWVVIGKK